MRKIVLNKLLKIFIPVSLPLQVLLLHYLAEQPKLVERFYTGSIYKFLSYGLRFAFGGFSFPVGQFVFYTLIAAVLFWIVRQVRQLLQKQVSKKQFLLSSGLGVLAIASGFYFLFNFMWGINYYRQPIHEIVQIDTRAITPPELEAMSARLIELTNQSRNLLTSDSLQPLAFPLSHEQILAKAPQGYGPIGKLYPAFTYQHPSVKSVLVPELMSYFGIAGIYFPFTGEANVNMDPPSYLLPETVCHEMAHQTGVASEDEANFVAYLTCQMNPDPAFKYSGNLMAMRYTLNRLYQQDSTAYYRQIQQLNSGVLCDLEVARDYWNRFENPVEVVGRMIHDLFLKANNQTEGVVSYSRVVELLMGEYRKNGFKYEVKQESGKS
jgi:hypothetical protein